MPYSIDRSSYRKDTHLPVGVGWSMRPGGIRPTAIVIHTTSAEAQDTTFDAEARYLYNSREVSAHFLNGKQSQIVQFLDPQLEAWHAGQALSAYQNDHSIGIENHVSVGEPWTAIQHDSLTWLVKRLMAQYAIAPTQIETHRAIALPGPNIRKHDPTGWDDVSFYAWRASLVPRTVFAGPYGAIARQDYRAGAAAAAYFAPGLTITIDDFHRNEYRHAASGVGFLADGDLVFA